MKSNFTNINKTSNRSNQGTSKSNIKTMVHPKTQHICPIVLDRVHVLFVLFVYIYV